MDDITARLTAFLAGRTNYERTRSDRPRFSLETMTALLAALGLQERGATRAVQIGGSKGKGTTAAYLAALARAAGLRVGVYASPHVRSIRERIRIDGHDIEAAELERVVHAVTAAGDAAGLQPPPSFFEILTAAAVSCFRDAGVDLAVYEVGLGGRLDATTAVAVDASILTSVELEHTEILGDTIAAIAAEKACVVRPGGIGFVALHGAALEVARAHAERSAARLEVLGRDFTCRDDPDAADGLHLARGTRRTTLRVPGIVAHERGAAALAWAALTELFPGHRLPASLPRPFLPGRFELRTCDDGELLLLDGAHTAESARLVARELLARTGGRPARVLMAIARGKRWREVLSALRPAVDTLHATRLRGTASVEPEELVAAAAAFGLPACVVADAAEGWSALCAAAGPRLVTGSFYLVGEVHEVAGFLQP